MYDIIGDIHGHADKLEELLLKLGYSKKQKQYSHPERKVLFLGDYIDRGPKIHETLKIVKHMVEGGSAIALMGNHEYNAICFHTKRMKGGYLRKHSIKNILQHFKTLKDFNDHQSAYDEYIQWFKTLPLFFENENFRAVHACWDHDHINYLKSLLIKDRLTEHLITTSADKENKLFHSVEVTLKGKEIPLPNGKSFKDKDENERTQFRIKWWENPASSTYKSISLHPIENLIDEPIVINPHIKTNFYKEDEKPVFFGHYWLHGNPMLYRNNICCCDYSVAKEGLLVAYRYDGEKKLDEGKFVYV